MYYYDLVYSMFNFRQRKYYCFAFQYELKHKLKDPKYQFNLKVGLA